MKVFYPMSFGSTGAIATVYQNVAKHSAMESVAFEVDDPSVPLNGVDTRPIPDDRREQFRQFVELMGEADVCHTGPRFPNVLTPLVKYWTATKLVHTVHAADIPSLGGNSKMNVAETVLRNGSDAITTISDFVATETRENTRWLRSPEFHIIPNGVDFHLFDPNILNTVNNRMLYIGRNTNQKNPQFVSELTEQSEDIEFRVRIQGISDKLKSDFKSRENTTILSHMDKEEISAEYAAANCVLCPYEREGFGLVVLEALASGTPVVGLADGHLVELLSDTPGGYLCESLSVPEWLRTMDRAAEDPNEALIRSSVTEYSWGNISAEYDRIYESV